MAFTSNSDINIIQASDNPTISAAYSNDVYVVGHPEDLLSTGQKITVSDIHGNNIIRLIEGLTISSVQLTSTTLRLTFSNSSQVTILSANNFSFGIGGDAFGREETIQSFSDFAVNTLGLEGLPSTGSLSKDNVVIGNNNVNPEYTVISIDQGDLLDPEIFNADGDSFKFTESAALSNNVIIEEFANDDIIEVSASNGMDYSFTNDGQDVIASLNINGVISMITLIGVVSEDVIIDGYDSFKNAIGFDAFVFV
ncbi:MAG: hypothetical protein AB7U45_01450 [Desulfamplus sp.]